MTTAQPQTTINGWTFRRVSDAYIDVFAPGNTTTAVDCIGVWDYDEDEPTIDRSRAALRRAGNLWLAENREWLDDYRSLAH